MEWSELGRAWLAQLGENHPNDETAPEAQPETQTEATPSDHVRLKSRTLWATLALGGVMVFALGTTRGEPVGPSVGHCSRLPLLHRHGDTARPLPRPISAYARCG